MVDSFSEVSSEGYFSRIGGSIKGILFGGFLYLVCFPLLFFNEGCAVKRYQDLAAGRGAIVEVPRDKIDTANENKLVYLSGEATTDETLRDEAFAVEFQGIRLQRTAEMYQWRENEETSKKKKLGGGQETTTTYDYEKLWSDSLIKSEAFHVKGRADHKNPKTMEITSTGTSSKQVKLGAFTLSPNLVHQIQAFQNLTITDAMLAAARSSYDTRTVTQNNGWIYLGSDSAASDPRVGDIRVRFTSVATPQTVSLFAAQHGESFTSWKAPSGRVLEQSLQLGSVTADEMFAGKESERARLTWIFRGVGLMAMFAAVSMILRPLSVLADVVPMLGSIVGVGTAIVAFLVALPSALLTIAVAWIFYRPWVGIPLVVVSIAAIIGLGVLMRKKRNTPMAVEAI